MPDWLDYWWRLFKLVAVTVGVPLLLWGLLVLLGVFA